MKATSKMRKAMASVLATSMALSCMAAFTAYAEEETSGGEEAVVSTEDASSLAFYSGNEGQDITVEDPTGDMTRQYNLYQIFSGDLKEGALIDIDWGASIVYKENGLTVYDYSEELVNELKSEKLKNGEANPLKADFENMTGTAASEVAGIVATYADEKTGVVDTEKVDAFATAVGALLEEHIADGTAIQTRQVSGSSSSTKAEYIFNSVENGYYMVSEVIQGKGLTYSKYMTKVGTNSEKGTKIEAKSSAAPVLDKYIMYGTDDPDTTEVDESLHEYQEVAIDQTVTFKLISEVPKMDGYNRYYYVVNDEMSAGMTYTKNSMKITVNGEELQQTTNTTATGKYYELEVTYNKDGTTSFTIVFKDFLNQYKSLEGADIVITYDATVDEDVVVGATNENKNTANLTYSNNPNYNYEGTPEDKEKGTPGDPDKPNPGDPDNPDNPGDPTDETPDDTVYVYTAGIDVVKVDGDGNRLTGAKFKLTGVLNKGTEDEQTVEKYLEIVPKYNATCYASDEATAEDTEDAKTVQYYKLKDGTFTADPPVDNGSATTSTVGRYLKENVKYTMTSEGTYVKDAKNGTYYKNTTDDSYVAIDGASKSGSYEQDYVLYEADSKKNTMNIVSVSKDGNDAGSVIGEVSGDDGSIMFYGLAPGEYTLTEYEAPTGYDKIDDVINVEVKFEKPTADWVCGWNYTVTYEDKDGNSISSASVQSSTANGVCELFVENLTTHTLPSTGGIGTTVFYVAGSLLATAAGVMLVAKKRARKEEEADAE